MHEPSRAQERPMLIEMIAAEEAGDRVMLRWAMVLAVGVHVALALSGWTFEVRADDRPWVGSRETRLFEVAEFSYVLGPRLLPKPPRALPPSCYDLDSPEPIGEPGPRAERAPMPPEPEPTPVPTGPRRAGLDVPMPRRLAGETPTATEAARKARVAGSVILEVVIDPEGRIAEVTVLRGLPEGLTERAVEVVRGWRFEPSLVDGRPVEVKCVLVVHFLL